MTICLASSNKGKRREISAMLPPGWALKSLADLGINENIPETGFTLSENSLLKARYLSSRCARECQAVIADDSGLEVNALGGAPGVYSARYAGEAAGDTANNEKLLRDMRDKTDRRARFVTVITLLSNGQTHQFEGEIRGTIAHAPRGSNGFGYDPLFIPTGYRSTFAELPAEVKNAISHRAAAFRKLAAHIGQRSG